jgi:8-oxo-dGTP pyrophosphatase MutT (NUDIX family)
VAVTAQQTAAMSAGCMDRQAARRRDSPPDTFTRVTEPIRAAGGVVVSDGKVLLVHRPRYDDWTLPKGKLDQGESSEDAALREVEEETGLRCTLGRELPSTKYTVGTRPKEVRYWLMEPESEAPFEPNDETDDLRWLTRDEAMRLLSYDRDRDVLAAAL